MAQKIKGLNWVNPKNKRQAEWIIEYATKSFPYVQLANSYPVSDEEKVLKIIEDLKQHYWREPDATAYQIGKMRNAWYQKQKRDGRRSESYLSVSISKEAKRALDTLTKGSGKKQNEVIEELLIDGSVTAIPSEKVASDQLPIIMAQLEQLQQENQLIKERLAQVDGLNQQRWRNSATSSHGEI
ncbi:hypothetical protein HYO25_15435 [Vibrio parahaemolyticus]|nr:hypothetical protein [Vibrio parahaemolyticus]